MFYVVPVEEREVDSFNMDRYVDHCKDVVWAKKSLSFNLSDSFVGGTYSLNFVTISDLS